MVSKSIRLAVLIVFALSLLSLAQVTSDLGVANGEPSASRYLALVQREPYDTIPCRE